MNDEHLAEQASLYAAGALTPPERELFELLLEFHPELRTHTAGLLEIATGLTLASQRSAVPCPTFKSRILEAIEGRSQSRENGLVVTGPDRLVQWVNPAFTRMCGFTLDELEGKSLGPVLQGKDTDAATAERMRRAVHENRPCLETILNYHKDGTPYWVEIDIRPILGESGEVRWLVARERELPEPLAA